jgi:hypothetical protein
MTGIRAAIAIAVIYVGISIFTFGYAAEHHRCTQGRSQDDCDLGIFFSVAAATVFWPLYWSWEWQRPWNSNHPWTS